MNSETKQVGWLFVVWWIGLTIVGGLVGNYVADKLFAGLQVSNIYLGILFSMLGGGVFGLTVSAAQWILLRRYIPKTIWWMITGTAGYAFGALIGSIFVWMLNNPSNLQGGTWLALSYVIIRGTVLGAFQWAFLKQFRTHTGWWVLGNGIGWMLGPMIATFFLASTINDFIIQIMVDVLAGIITGTLIFWILHQPTPEQNDDQISTVEKIHLAHTKKSRNGLIVGGVAGFVGGFLRFNLMGSFYFGIPILCLGMPIFSPLAGVLSVFLFSYFLEKSKPGYLLFCALIGFLAGFLPFYYWFAQ